MTYVLNIIHICPNIIDDEEFNGDVYESNDDESNDDDCNDDESSDDEF